MSKQRLKDFPPRLLRKFVMDHGLIHPDDDRGDFDTVGGLCELIRKNTLNPVVEIEKWAEETRNAPPTAGMIRREQDGRAIAEAGGVIKHRKCYIVPSQSDPQGTMYIVSLDNETCTCPDFERRQDVCKHIFAVAHFVTSRQKKTARKK